MGGSVGTTRRSIAAVVAFAVAAGLLAAAVGIATARDAGDDPRLQLLRGPAKVTVKRSGKGSFWVDPGIFVGVRGEEDLNLVVGRPTYRKPVEIIQHTTSGDRTLPADTLDDWKGLAEFLDMEVTDASGHVVLRRSDTFCPNAWNRNRLSDDGPVNSIFPGWCSAMPLSKGTVWGIDAEWAVGAYGGGEGLRLSLPNGTYTLHVSIAPRYRDLFDISDTDASVTVRLKVKRGAGGCSGCPIPEPGYRQGPISPAVPSRGVPTVTHPDPATLPNLVALPSWGIRVINTRGGSSLIFGATVWVRGNGPLVVEGWRKTSEDTMDAYQYFYSGGAPVARKRVGAMRYDPRNGHRHWHFRQFAGYQLLDASRNQVVRSKKEAFCLAPTDALDLRLPAADWNPYEVGLATACGGLTALWVREALPVGWGDTYVQTRPGQAFDITDLPNGTYYIKVEANPAGSIEELRTGDNARYRTIRLDGPPRKRTVKVMKWNGIDTEVRGGWDYVYADGVGIPNRRS